VLQAGEDADIKFPGAGWHVHLLCNCCDCMLPRFEIGGPIEDEDKHLFPSGHGAVRFGDGGLIHVNNLGDILYRVAMTLKDGVYPTLFYASFCSVQWVSMLLLLSYQPR
jgi:hypothetical protein